MSTKHVLRPLLPGQDALTLFKGGTTTHRMSGPTLTSSLAPIIATAQAALGGVFQGLAGEILDAGMFVRLDGNGKVVYAEPDGLPVLGVTLNAAANNAAVSVQTIGVYTDAGYNLTPNTHCWLAAGGAITQTPPNDFVHPVAFAATATTLFLTPFQPIEVVP